MRTADSTIIAAEIETEAATLLGTLEIPPKPQGLVLFAHGSGSSRHSPRNQHVAERFRNAGLATLLFDLLTPDEESLDAADASLRFDVEFLAFRLRSATRWSREQPEAARLRIGYFGASTGAAAALIAAADEGESIRAVVSRGGRPDLAGVSLSQVRAPTLLIVGGHDREVISLNQQAFAELRCEKSFEIVPGAGHLFEEPGTLDVVAAGAARWFNEHFR